MEIEITKVNATIIQASVKGGKAVSFQWYRNEDAITDGHCYEGCKSNTLHIKTKSCLQGEFYCEVADYFSQRKLSTKIG